MRGDIPETVTVNLSRNTVWSLGTKTELVTTEKMRLLPSKKVKLVKQLMRKMKQRTKQLQKMKQERRID